MFFQDWGLTGGGCALRWEGCAAREAGGRAGFPRLGDEPDGGGPAWVGLCPQLGPCFRTSAQRSFPLSPSSQEKQGRGLMPRHVPSPQPPPAPHAPWPE